MSLPIVAIIGRPNVGKSRLFNRIAGKKLAIVSDVAGTTRDRVFAKVEEVPLPFMLVDTGGLEFDEQIGKIENDMQTQARIAMQEADVILFISDSKVEPLPQDYQVAELLRKSEATTKKPVIFALGKCDEPLPADRVAEFYSLGFSTPIQVSAIHKSGVETLLDRINQELRDLGYRKHDTKEEETEEVVPKIAFIGRPNVGKSSLINAFLSEERLIVSEVPGTTRDSVDSEVRWEKKPFIFIDTAGIRKRGKIEAGIEKWSIARTLQALDRADVACVLIDSEEGITSQDQHAVEQVLAAKKGLILIINKWDVQEKGEEARDEFLLDLRQRFPFLPWAPVLFVSAKNRTNIVKLFPLVEQVMEERKKRITTGKLNAFVREIISAHAPTGTKRVRPKIFYMSQVDINPPKFKIFVNKEEYFHFSFFRYLENKLREIFGFNGTALDIDIVDRESIYEKGVKKGRSRKPRSHESESLRV